MRAGIVIIARRFSPRRAMPNEPDTANTVDCVVPGAPAEALDETHYPGEVGQRSFAKVPKEGRKR